MKFLKIKIVIASFILIISPFAFSEPDYDPYGSHYDYSDNNSDNTVVIDDNQNYYSETEAPMQSVEVDYDENAERNMDRDIDVRGALYDDRLPKKIPSPGEKIIIVNPRIHAWGAYTPDGGLLRAGLATSGAKWCPDVKRACRTKVGVFRISSLGESSCVSTRYPLGKGGAPMPYCMFFNKNQGLHGSNEVVEGNVSHGCVRISVSDARWIRYQFANIGTKVIILSY